MGNKHTKNKYTKKSDVVIRKPQYPVFNEKFKKWSNERIEMNLIRNKKYQLDELKQIVVDAIDMDPDDINLWIDEWDPVIVLKLFIDQESYGVGDGLEFFNQIDIKIPFIIKYFYGNTIDDMVDNVNYKIFELKEFRREKLVDIINKKVTKNKVVTGSLICDMIEPSNFYNFEYFKKLINAYIMSIDIKLEISDDIIAMIIRYRLIRKNINIRETVKKLSLYPNCQLIVYKNFANKYIEYDNINNAEYFTIYINDFIKHNKLTNNERKTKQPKLQEIKINAFDTIKDVRRKMKEELNIDDIEGTLFFDGYPLCDIESRIIDWGIKHQSVVRLHFMLQKGS